MPIFKKIFVTLLFRKYIPQPFKLAPLATEFVCGDYQKLAPNYSRNMQFQ